MVDDNGKIVTCVNKLILAIFLKDAIKKFKLGKKLEEENIAAETERKTRIKLGELDGTSLFSVGRVNEISKIIKELKEKWKEN